MRTKTWIPLIIIFLLLASCTLPTGNQPAAAETPAAADVDAVGTSVALTTVVMMTELAGGSGAVATPTNTSESAPAAAANPTACVPMVTSTTAANVRSGPDTVYDLVGYLPLGGTANIAGRNDANTWWYIAFPGGAGGYAWISGTVVTASCVPAVVQVVAAPPTPTSPPLADTSGSEEEDDESSSGQPDLVASGFQYWPEIAQKGQQASVMVKVTNNGTATAGGFTVVWMSDQGEQGCDWQVQGLGVGKSKDLECDYTFKRGTNHWASFIVDSGNQVAESNEGNNTRDWEWEFKN